VLGKEVTALAKELHVLLTFVKNDFGAHNAMVRPLPSEQGTT
jgi:hypothetical protein